MGEQRSGLGQGSAATSYRSDDRLLAELREQWPPRTGRGEAGRGYVDIEIAEREPTVALRLSDRYAVALLPDAAGIFAVVPLVRDEIAVTDWRRARAGDGLSAFTSGVPMASERAIDADQTNDSVVVGERAIVKWFRRIGPGPSRATTLLRHLDAVGFREIPQPLGEITWRSPAGDLTIAQGDVFLPGARDGWDWAVERLAGHVAHGAPDCPAACDPWIGDGLGRLVGRLHRALATPSAIISDPTADADTDVVARWRAEALKTLDAALALDVDEPDSIGDLGPAMRAELAALGADRGIRIQPVHGDLHVGQILEWAEGLAVIDFDGNPALGSEANAVRQPVERDIAQMLSSLDHAARIVDRRTGGGARAAIDGWIARTRRDFLEALDRDPDPTLLAAFEVEQECRELIYAARFLPRWRYAPLATLHARYGRVTR